jgi:hypothetical protein
VFVPKALLAGWIKRPAEVNPFTVFLEEGRAYISGQSPDTLLAFGVAGGLVVALTVWSVLGLRRAARSS